MTDRLLWAYALIVLYLLIAVGAAWRWRVLRDRRSGRTRKFRFRR